MPFRIGLLLYPLSIAAWKLSRPSVIAEFDKVNAYSEETSRKPASLGLPGKATRRAIARKLLLPVGDGRFYLDRIAVRRAETQGIVLLVLGTLAFIPLVWLML